ncbi:MAG TPA: hypothetical protein VFP50_18195 [Anaeromyxobacteraceae bacterium]|nr:hypothetical protein [Anaeromyxobacteraceae bacterium]
MAKPPLLSLKAEDFSRLMADYPEFEALLRNLNRFATQVTASLNRGATFAENIASQEATLVFDTDATNAIVFPPGRSSLTVALRLPQGLKAKHVTITRAVTVDTSTRQESPVVLSGPAWTTSGDLVITGVGGTVASRRYRANLLIVGG